MEGKKVKIYALANTLNGSVFYIGATVQRLEARLSSHVNTCLGSKKKDYMREICKQGGSIEIFQLDECDFEQGSFWEQYYIDLFRAFGFNLIQRRTSAYNECKPQNRRRGPFTWSAAYKMMNK